MATQQMSQKFSWIVTILAALGVVGAFSYESWRDRGAQRFQAIAAGSSFFQRSGVTLTDVDLLNAGPQRPARVTLRAWFLRLRRGEHVQVIAPAGSLAEVRPAGFWPEHFFSVVAITAVALVAAAELLFLSARKFAPRANGTHAGIAA